MVQSLGRLCLELRVNIIAVLVDVLAANILHDSSIEGPAHIQSV